jgi:hypothetical protein
VALLMGLEYNYQLNDLTTQDKHFFQCLRACLPVIEGPTNVIMRSDDVDMSRWGTVCHCLIRSHYCSDQVNLQLLKEGPPITGWSGYNTMVFGPAACGVQMMTGDEGVAWVPYSAVVFASYDGERVTLLPRLTPQDLAGYRVEVQSGASLRSLHPASLRAEGLTGLAP